MKFSIPYNILTDKKFIFKIFRVHNAKQCIRKDYVIAISNF